MLREKHKTIFFSRLCLIDARFAVDEGDSGGAYIHKRLNDGCRFMNIFSVGKYFSDGWDDVVSFNLETQSERDEQRDMIANAFTPNTYIQNCIHLQFTE